MTRISKPTSSRQFAKSKSKRGFSIISVRVKQLSALDRLKLLQAQFKKTWIGVNTDYTGRPGTSNLTNKNRKFRALPKLETENERNQEFVKMLATLRNVEQ